MLNSDAYSEPYQIYTIELLANLVNGWKLLTIFTKSFILAVSQVPDYASEMKSFDVVSISIVNLRYYNL